MAANKLTEFLRRTICGRPAYITKTDQILSKGLDAVVNSAGQDAGDSGRTWWASIPRPGGQRPPALCQQCCDPRDGRRPKMPPGPLSHPFANHSVFRPAVGRWNLPASCESFWKVIWMSKVGAIYRCFPAGMIYRQVTRTH